MYEIFGTTYYFSGQGGLLYLLVYVPLTLLVVRRPPA